MNIMKPNNSQKQGSAGRRSFIRKAGGALSAVFASAVAGTAAAGPGENETLQEQVRQLTDQLGVLEDQETIRRLHRAYGDYLGKGMYDEIVQLFTDDGEVYFNGSVFKGKDQGIRRLYVEHFGRGIRGDSNGPVHSFMFDDTHQQDLVEVAPDRKSAQARFHNFMQVWTRDNAEFPMMDLAREQGQGILRRVEGGIHDIVYVNDAGSWKIRRLDYRSTGNADDAFVARQRG